MNLIIALILCVAMVTSTYLARKNWEQQSIQEAMTKATIMTATVMNSIVVEMSGFCRKDVQKIVANVGAVPEIDTVRIFDEDGIITCSAAPDEVGRAADSLDYSVFQSEEKTRPFKSEGSGHRSFCMVQPIDNGLECRRCHGHEREILGVLDACVSMAETEKRIAGNSRFLFMSTFTTVVLMVLAISISLWILVNMPVNRLVNTMARAEKGNLSARTQIRRKDELGHLAQSLNSMLEKLDESDRELKRYHAEQMTRADRLATIGELAAGIAHEIKNPLAGIAGKTELKAAWKAFQPGILAVPTRIPTLPAATIPGTSISGASLRPVCAIVSWLTRGIRVTLLLARISITGRRCGGWRFWRQPTGSTPGNTLSFPLTRSRLPFRPS